MLTAIVLALVFAAFFAVLILVLQYRAAKPKIDAANKMLDEVDRIIGRSSRDEL